MPGKPKGAAGEGRSKSKDAKSDVTKLEAYKALTERFGTKIPLDQLVDLATQAAQRVIGLKDPTGADKKSTDKLYQWFQANWSSISPQLDDLDVGDDEEEDDEEGGDGK